MLQNIFSNQSIAHLIELFLWMFGAFLIGYLFARNYYKRKSSTTPLITLTDPEKISTDTSTIKAKKTFDRGGEQVIEQIKEEEIIVDTPIPTLDFNSFGKATESDKDDLKKIKGIGELLEVKLNKNGIYTYKQISLFTKKDIDALANLIKFSSNKIENADWVNQAKKLAK